MSSQNPSIYNNLAIFYAKIGRKKEALNYFHKSINLRENTNKEDPILYNYYHNIAKLYEEDKDYSKASYYYQKKVNLLELLVSEDLTYQDKLITSYDNLANLYAKSHNRRLSLKYYQKEKRFLKKELSQDNVIKIVSANQNIISLIKNPQIHDKYYLESINLLEKYQSSETTNLLAHTYIMLANHYTSLKRYKEAKNYYLKSISIREKQNEEESFFNCNFLIISYLHLLSLYYRLDDKSNALSIQNKLNKIIERIYAK